MVRIPIIPRILQLLASLSDARSVVTGNRHFHKPCFTNRCRPWTQLVSVSLGNAWLGFPKASSKSTRGKPWSSFELSLKPTTSAGRMLLHSDQADEVVNAAHKRGLENKPPPYFIPSKIKGPVFVICAWSSKSIIHHEALSDLLGSFT
jgi:hypothetical protein